MKVDYFIHVPVLCPCTVRQMNYFDYGVKLNLERYGQAKPPSVRLNATTIPCSLFAFQNSTVVTTAVRTLE